MALSIPASLQRPAIGNSNLAYSFHTGDSPKENRADVICFTKDFGGPA